MTQPTDALSRDERSLRSTEKEAGEISIAGFLSLAVLSGLTIGMAKIVTQLFAISIGADAFQIGVISAMESVGMMLLTVPAGFIIARHGAKTVYAIASLGPLFVNLFIPALGSWWTLALARLLIGLCIPFRTVSMNSAFLSQLRRIGDGKAGWYRGSFTLGVAVLGPAAATLLVTHASYGWGFAAIAALFAVMAGFSLSFFPAREPGASGEAPTSPWRQITSLLRNPELAESCAIEFLSNATASLFGTFVLLVAMRLPGLSAADGVNVLLVDGLTTMAALFLGANLLRRLDRRQAYAIGLALAVASLGITASANGLLALMAAGILLAGATALVHLVNMILLSRLPGEKSKAAGVYQLSQMLGATSGAMLGGALSRLLPLQTIFLACIPLLLAAALPIALFGRQSVLLSSPRR